MEEMLKMLEEGGTLPDIEGLIAAEDPKVCLRQSLLQRTVAALDVVLDTTPTPLYPYAPEGYRILPLYHFEALADSMITSNAARP